MVYMKQSSVRFRVWGTKPSRSDRTSRYWNPHSFESSQSRRFLSRHSLAEAQTLGTNLLETGSWVRVPPTKEQSCWCGQKCKSKFCICFEIDIFSFFFEIFVFSVIIFIIKFSDESIRTADFWYQKQLLCHLSPNYGSFCVYFAKYSVVQLWHLAHRWKVWGSTPTCCWGEINIFGIAPWQPC